MGKVTKKAVVIHSGGMDSSLCLALAIQEFGREHVLSLSFHYGQRHISELTQAKKICHDWAVDHTVISLDCLKEITNDALTNHHLNIITQKNCTPNTLVMGRNGLFVHLTGIHAHALGARLIFTGVMQLEEANSGYRDCSRKYMDLQQEILRIDLNDPEFEIRTPLVFLTKLQTLEWAHQLGILDYLLENTVTCYEGIMNNGCGKCPACLLRNRAIEDFFTQVKAN